MEGYPEPISEEQWDAIASAVDPGSTVQQIQDQWYNIVQPTIPFNIPERRQIVGLALDHPCDWRRIARQVRDGNSRYVTMVRHCAMNLFRRLSSLGFELESSSDVALVPDAVLARDRPKGTLGQTLLAEYLAKKARQIAEAAEGPQAVQTTAGTESPISTPLSPLDGESVDESGRK
jgi:hypothetical protein